MLADVAGYSRLMEQDESGTHLRLREIRQQVTDPQVARYRGRVVRSKGDDMLVEFGSAADALACALAIQQEMQARNEGVDVRSRIAFRIGINLGDILVEADEIAGDGVNLAARLETLAEPGGIAMSQAVHDQVRQMAGVRLIDTGLHRVKNMARPVRVYTAVTSASQLPLGNALVRRRLVRSLQWPLALLALAAVAWWLSSWLSATADKPDARGEAPPQSIAVLPAIAGAEYQRAAARFGEDLSAALSRVLHGTVTAHSAAIAAAGRSTDPRSAGNMLNVRYLVESTYAEIGDEMQVAVRLLSSETGAQLWSSTVSSVRTADGSTPLPVLARLLDALTVEMDRADLAQHKAGNAAATALSLTLQAKQMLRLAVSDEELTQVQDLVERAIAIDADHGGALQWLAATLLARADRADQPADAEALYQRANEMSMRAVVAVPADPQAWRIRANVLTLRGNAAGAAEAIERALMLNPADQLTYGQRGSLLQSLGRQEEAIRDFNRAIELNPASENVGLHLHNRCAAELLLGRYAEAVDSCTRGLAHGPDWPDYMLLTAAHALAGNRDAAIRSRTELLRMRPQFRVGWIAGSNGPADPAVRRQYERHLVAGLRLAGVPE
jgi:class 3 adenylate cyclase/tetratricopeptide (TPR) repeat protein